MRIAPCFCLGALALASGVPCQGWAAGKKAFVRRQGARLVAGVDDHEIRLRGVNFQTDILITPDGEWTRDESDPRSRPMTDRYDEHNIRDMKQLGFDTIRFLLNHRIFADDRRPGIHTAPGWAFVDRYVAWAREHDLHLILDMHVPPGGLQSNGEGEALWSERENQDRLVDLWRAIARRYRDEPRIAGYGLLNEPHPQTAAQWKALAQRTVDAIRAVDSNHLIIVEHVTWATEVSADWSPSLLESFQFVVKDPKGNENVMYGRHFYEPRRYALQLTPATRNRDGGKYPDSRERERTYDGQAMRRSRAFLERQLAVTLVEFSRKHRVPMNVGEWAPMDETFASKGGLVYVEDLLELFDKYGLSWQYYSVDALYADGALERLEREPADVFRKYFESR